MSIESIDQAVSSSITSLKGIASGRSQIQEALEYCLSQREKHNNSTPFAQYFGGVSSVLTGDGRKDRTILAELEAMEKWAGTYGGVMKTKEGSWKNRGKVRVEEGKENPYYTTIQVINVKAPKKTLKDVLMASAKEAIYKGDLCGEELEVTPETLWAEFQTALSEAKTNEKWVANQEEKALQYLATQAAKAEAAKAEAAEAD